MSHVIRKPVLPYANNKGADQPAHLHSVISAFVVCSLDSTISIIAKAKISRPWLVSSWAGWFESYLVSNPEERFSCDEAHVSWVLSYTLSAQRRLWSEWTDAQADLSLRWAHRSFCWFCHAVAHFIPLMFQSFRWCLTFVRMYIYYIYKHCSSNGLRVMKLTSSMDASEDTELDL